MSPETAQAPAIIIGVVADAIVTQLRTAGYGSIARSVKASNLPASSFGLRALAWSRAVEDVLRRIDPGAPSDDNRSQ
jgi:hypothetical protein